MKVDILGRSNELKLLESSLHSNQPEFIAIYGRRRVGKTYLIKTYFSHQENIIFFNCTGTKDGPYRDQLKHFAQCIGETFLNGIVPATPNNWDNAFRMLTNIITNTKTNSKIVLFLDEFPWMATKNSRLLQTLEYYWNQYWSTLPKIKLIICGSSASWILKKIINNKGGLHNRVTQRVKVNPFKLKDVKTYLASQKINLNHKQISELYMVTGGIPFYLKGLNKGRTSAQLIEALAFEKNSLLLNEFDNLFSSLFDDPSSYIEILRFIAKKRYGVRQTDLDKNLANITKGGRLSEKLSDLKEAGFITAIKPYNNKRGIYYRVIDEYSLFYFYWIEPIRATIHDDGLEPGYWQGMQASASWRSWSGYSFEALCYKHISIIRRKLAIPPTALAYSWQYKSNTKQEGEGAQIDLLFDRLDDCITLCEIKFNDNPFSIDKSYAKSLLNKQKIFKAKTRTKKQLFISMITANGLLDNLYANDIIDDSVTLDDFFE